MQDRYAELLNFEMKFTYILETKAYALTDEENVPVIKNWLGWEGLQLIKTFTYERKEKCRVHKGLLSLLNNKFKL